LEEVAGENENVLDDPPPSVIVESFGDNSLAILLWCFAGTTELRYPTIRALNEAIAQMGRLRNHASIRSPTGDGRSAPLGHVCGLRVGTYVNPCLFCREF
jgi:hypothetical protein